MIYIKKYYCKNGEIVYAKELNPYDIIVYYKGKKHLRSKDIIGKTIFPVKQKFNSHNTSKKAAIKIGSTVTIENCQNSEILTVKICGVRAERTYKRMGGSYYGNSVKISYVGDDINLSDNTLCVSVVSPLGKALVNKSQGEIAVVALPDKVFERYKIVNFK